MAPAVTRQSQEANTKLAMTFFPLPESSGSSYFRITNEITILKMVIKSSVLIKEKKTDVAVYLLSFKFCEPAESSEKRIKEFI